MGNKKLALYRQKVEWGKLNQKKKEKEKRNKVVTDKSSKRHHKLFTIFQRPNLSISQECNQKWGDNLAFLKTLISSKCLSFRYSSRTEKDRGSRYFRQFIKSLIKGWG